MTVRAHVVCAVGLSRTRRLSLLELSSPDLFADYFYRFCRRPRGVCRKHLAYCTQGTCHHVAIRGMREDT